MNAPIAPKAGLRIAIIRHGKTSIKEVISILPTLNELLAQPVPYDIVVIDQPSSQAESTLRLLRMNKHYHLSLIYSLQDLTPLLENLGDGKAPVSMNSMRRSIKVHQDRLQEFNRGMPPQTLEWRMMAWMWLRQDRKLEPIANPKHAQHYHYPIIDMLANGEKVNTFQWLNGMVEKGIFQEMGLIDRVRTCSSCTSARINFIDVCPECSHIDIERSASLHCYTCGHIGHQDKFMKGGALICPHCTTRLRHIGSDYDRPMDNYTCNGCKSFFVDAKVQAKCRDCGHDHGVDDLLPINIQRFQLAENGKLMCRHGDQNNQSMSSAYRRGNFISNLHFTDILDLQIQMSRRYGGFEFSLVGIQMGNLDAYMGKVGFNKSCRFIDQMIDRINATFRDTDRGARFSENRFWLVLPNTNEAGLLSFKTRLTEVFNQVTGEGSELLNISLLGYSSCMDEKVLEDGALLLSRLENDLGA
jgi:GGDEF domain-containing protein